MGLRLFELRRRLGFTQGVMATKLGISDRAYVYYEAGKRDAPVGVLVKAMELSGEDLRWIVLGYKPIVYHPEPFGRALMTAVDVLHAKTDEEREKALKLAVECYDNAILKGTEPEEEVRRLGMFFAGGEGGQ